MGSDVFATADGAAEYIEQVQVALI